MWITSSCSRLSGFGSDRFECIKAMEAHMHTHTHIHANTQKCTYPHAPTPTCTNTHIHTRTHAHIQTHIYHTHMHTMLYATPHNHSHRYPRKRIIQRKTTYSPNLPPTYSPLFSMNAPPHDVCLPRAQSCHSRPIVSPTIKYY